MPTADKQQLQLYAIHVQPPVARPGYNIIIVVGLLVKGTSEDILNYLASF